MFVLGLKARTGSLESFMERVLDHRSQLESNGRFTFSAEDTEGERVSLSLYLYGDGIPEVNGSPVDLCPGLIYDSPYLTSVHGSGIIGIRKGDQMLVLDLNHPEAGH